MTREKLVEWKVGDEVRWLVRILAAVFGLTAAPGMLPESGADHERAEALILEVRLLQKDVVVIRDDVRQMRQDIRDLHPPR